MQTIRTALALAAALSIAAAVSTHRPVAGQATVIPHKASEAPTEYRLSLPLLRQLLPPMLWAEMGGFSCDALLEVSTELSSMTAAELSGLIGRCTPLKSELERFGISTPEAARAYTAFGEAMDWLEASQSESALPPDGVLRENVRLLRESEEELGRIADEVVPEL